MLADELYKCLLIANCQQMHSIAIPIIDTGIPKQYIKSTAKIFCNFVIKYCQNKRSENNLREIRWITNEEATRDIFLTELNAVILDKGPVPIPNALDGGGGTIGSEVLTHSPDGASNSSTNGQAKSYNNKTTSGVILDKGSPMINNASDVGGGTIGSEVLTHSQILETNGVSNNQTTSAVMNVEGTIGNQSRKEIFTSSGFRDRVNINDTSNQTKGASLLLNDQDISPAAFSLMEAVIEDDNGTYEYSINDLNITVNSGYKDQKVLNYVYYIHYYIMITNETTMVC